MIAFQLLCELFNDAILITQLYLSTTCVIEDNCTVHAEEDRGVRELMWVGSDSKTVLVVYLSVYKLVSFQGLQCTMTLTVSAS